MSSSRAQSIQLSPIKEIELAAVRVPGVVSLAQGIPSFDTPEVIKEAVKQHMDRGQVARYSLTPGLPALRERVARSLLEDGMRYDPDGEIIITAGSIEAISATLLAVTEPGDEVIIPSPTYASYQQVIRMAGCVPRFVALDEENNFDLDTGALQKAITPRTKALFYCNPNNPTGTIYSKAQSLRMLELAERHGLLIITDEVYKDFLYHDEPYFTPAQEAAHRDRVVRIFSFSKAYAMTGWRVGYLHTGRQLAGQILKVHDALVTCAPVISQYAAMAALEHGQADIARFHQAYRQRRDLTLCRLDRMTDIFDYQKPDGAYFVFPRVKDTVPLAADSRALAFDILERGGVALVPGVAFGPTGESHLRFSFGREPADIELAFDRLESYFRQARAPGLAQSGQTAQTAGHPTPPPAPSAPRRHGWIRGLGVAYLNGLAKLWLLRKRPVVVAIAGNHGKTVYKRTLAALLRHHRPFRANPLSYNTEVGLPLAVLGLEINPRSLASILATLLKATWRALLERAPVELLVLELGSRQRGDMARLLATVRPHWAVITGFAPQEMEETGDSGLWLEEFDRLAAQVPPERMVVSGEDPLLARHLAQKGWAPTLLGPQRMAPRPGGYTIQGERDTYLAGPDMVGASAVAAVQAALLLGEKLNVPKAALDRFLNEETGG